MGLLGFDAILEFDLQYQISDSRLRIFAILSTELGILAFCDFNRKAISGPPKTLAISGILAILRFQPESDFNQGPLVILGILAFLQFQRGEKPISDAPGTLAISRILAILRLSTGKQSSSTRDPCEFKEFSNFAILVRKQFQFHQEPLRF
jgi:hypothetical protein